MEIYAVKSKNLEHVFTKTDDSCSTVSHVRVETLVVVLRGNSMLGPDGETLLPEFD